MIPRIIHYCWFGHNEKPTIVKKCIASWNQYMPDYQIKEWNEENYDINKSRYMKEAYREKMWAFVSDYARFDILCEYGGIYFDTDVELLRSIPRDILLNNCFTGIESTGSVSPGLVLGAIPKHQFIQKMLYLYNDTTFNISNRKYKTVNEFATELLSEYGFLFEDRYQEVYDVAIYPSCFFCGYDQNIHAYDIRNTTISVHHYAGTWKKNKIKKIISKKVLMIIGEKNYRVLLRIKRKLFGISK